mmetsp:Transcript_6743/g.23027  ORF Transcript_6743/g.23027 Transcript_6743/m.23027 type:complete len:325 (-) Transcript_6743:670-1644(-)
MPRSSPKTTSALAALALAALAAISRSLASRSAIFCLASCFGRAGAGGPPAPPGLASLASLPSWSLAASSCFASWASSSLHDSGGCCCGAARLGTSNSSSSQSSPMAPALRCARGLVAGPRAVQGARARGRELASGTQPHPLVGPFLAGATLPAAARHSPGSCSRPSDSCACVLHCAARCRWRRCRWLTLFLVRVAVLDWAERCAHTAPPAAFTGPGRLQPPTPTTDHGRAPHAAPSACSRGSAASPSSAGSVASASTSSRRCAWMGIFSRTAARRSRSTSHTTSSGLFSGPASPSTSPQGSTASACPKDLRFSLCAPTWAAAST